MKPDALVDRIVNQYLTSGDFNGPAGDALVGKTFRTLDELKELLRPLITGTLIVNTGDVRIRTIWLASRA
jgi:hypothetical protein